MAKGGIFAIGILSMIFAAGIFVPVTLLFGGTTNVEGANPIEHVSTAPIVT
jgi:hypothetical protein